MFVLAVLSLSLCRQLVRLYFWRNYYCIVYCIVIEWLLDNENNLSSCVIDGYTYMGGLIDFICNHCIEKIIST